MAAGLLFLTVLAAGVQTAVSCGSQSSSTRRHSRFYAHCYFNEHNPYLQFGDATSYTFARGQITRKDCEVLSVWMLARHGTRYPDGGDYKGFKVLEQIKKELLDNDLKQELTICKEDINNLRTNQLVLPTEKAGRLTEAGKDELFDLGSRLSCIFPELSERVEQLQKYKFMFANIPGKESAEYFMKGLAKFVPKDSKNLPATPTTNSILNYYARCNKWLRATKKYEEERKVFQGGKEMQNVLGMVTLRLGMRLGSQALMNMESLLILYDACRLQKAMVGRFVISPWCAIFTKDELKVLEYSIDLYHYYKSGPGTFNLNRKLACPAVKSMIDTFRQAVSNSKGRPSVFYFSDHIMLDILQVGLDLTTTSDVPPPTTDNYDRQNKRDYRTSKTMPSGGNILAILFRCNGKEKVEFYRNVDKLVYPECRNSNGLCDWNTINQKFSKYVDSKACLDMSWCNAA